MNGNHIYIHSLWRTSSTYVWHSFRQLDEVKGFYEPFHTCLSVMTPKSSKGSNESDLGHTIGSPYWLEYEEIAKPDGGIPHYHKKFAVSCYVPPKQGLPDDQKAYIQVLLTNAEMNGKQACLGFVRSCMRVGAIRAALGGAHIALVRNPYAQFTSYRHRFGFMNNAFQVFEVITSRARNVKIWYDNFCNNLPPEYHDSVRFATFYLFSNLTAIIHSQLIIDTDLLACDLTYRADTVENIHLLTKVRPDFSTCLPNDHLDPNLNNHYKILSDAIYSLNEAIAENHFPGSTQLWNAYPQSMTINEGLAWLVQKLERSKMDS